MRGLAFASLASFILTPSSVNSTFPIYPQYSLDEPKPRHYNKNKIAKRHKMNRMSRASRKRNF